MKLSIVIPSLNDYSETQATIASIRETAGDKAEIIVIDDCSQVPLSLVDKNCVLIRNEERAGVAASRHIGALAASGDLLLFLDAHMRCTPGWYEALMSRAKDRPTTMHNGCCVQLTPDQMDLTKAKGHYSGAYIHFHGPDHNDGGRIQILESKWLGHGDGEDDYVIPSIMGAIYACPKDFFLHVGGLRMLKGWGLDEPYLSLKWWLSGGDVRQLNSVRIGHQFKMQTSYKTEAWQLHYNRLMICLTVLPEAEGRRLIKLMETTPDLTLAKRAIEQDANQILADRAWNKAVFVRDFSWYLAYFGLHFPA